MAALIGALAMALPYLLLRLVDDFAGVSGIVLRISELGLILAVVGLAAYLPAIPQPVFVAMVVYFAGLTTYSSVRFIRQAARSRGVTRRRMQSVALGSALLALAIVLLGVTLLAPAYAPIGSLLLRGAVLGSGIAYYLGFAPPAWLRRAWQGPELREFLSRAAALPRLPDTTSVVSEFASGTATSLGAPAASIGLWDAAAGLLRFPAPQAAIPPSNPLVGRAFATQRAVYSAEVTRVDPDNADGYQALLAAPITAGTHRLGVLVVYATRAPVFADTDLELVRLLANQAAVILESRALIDQATQIQAREEATRLKDDFLSAAAHDLKTPLTTLVAQAQLLERRALMRPEAPPDLRGIQRIVTEARRLSNIVLELLDAAGVEQGQLVGRRVPTDLTQLARDACARAATSHHTCTVEAPDSLIGRVDAGRIEQLLANLLENAIKYSPEGGEVRVRLWREGDEAHIAVTDRGIGIPLADQPYVFERFHRGSNVDDRRFAGMGLGLYICRGIVQEHGGRVWFESVPDAGTSFYVALPLESGA